MESFLYELQKAAFMFRVQCNFFTLKKSYKLRRKHQHDRKYTLQTYKLLSGEAHVRLYVPHSF